MTGRINNIAVVIPTYNAGGAFCRLLMEIDAQTLKNLYKLLIDSGSSDGTVALAKNSGWHTVLIRKKDFSHGGTRQQALTMLPKDTDIAIYLTQDVRLPQKDCFEKLLQVFQNRDVSAAYGRQLPHKTASVYAAVDREFNYPPAGRIKSMEDSSELGIKTAFLSDSFAAYRVADLKKIGGFPRLDICEDMYAAGKLLLSGGKIAYVAEAEAEHSHEPCIKGMWHRYKMMGEFQRKNLWLKESFGSPGSEGIRLLKYQLKRVGKEKGIAGILKILLFDAVRLVSFKLAGG